MDDFMEPIYSQPLDFYGVNNCFMGILHCPHKEEFPYIIIFLIKRVLMRCLSKTARMIAISVVGRGTQAKVALCGIAVICFSTL